MNLVCINYYNITVFEWNVLTLKGSASENYTKVRGGAQSSAKCMTLEIRLLGPTLIRGLWGIKIWSICDHLKKKL